ncbi:MAG TPA: transposase [Candidatus Nitrosotenuis sp.]|nr:transposase [Candidatus Nitrosotenuis sp.]
MVNHCIKIGLENNCSTLNKLSMLSYRNLQGYDILSYYKLNAISQAAGLLVQRKKDIKKGKKVKSPFVRKPFLVSCYGFKINGMLLSFPVKNREFANILLTDHTVSEFSHEVKAKSFTITPTSLSISIQKEVPEIKPEGAIGIDRNLRNITISTPQRTIMYRTEKILSIKQNSQHVRDSFRRFDVRVKNRFFSKHRCRQTRRVRQHLHKISKHIVQEAKKTKSMIVFEDLTGIRRLYKKGNGQGKKFRKVMNQTIPNYEIQRQVTYKAKWEGIPVYFVNPKRTSMLCPICGGLLQEDRQNRRKLLCNNCGKQMDRDVVASMNVARKGWARFTHPGGLPDEAMKGNVENLQPLILRVHGSKLVAGS